MGGSQSGEAEREVTVEERAGEDGPPQIIVRERERESSCKSGQTAREDGGRSSPYIFSVQVTQDFLHYIRDREREEEGEGEGTSWDTHKAPPPQYQDGGEIPHVTAEDLVKGSIFCISLMSV